MLCANPFPFQKIYLQKLVQDSQEKARIRKEKDRKWGQGQEADIIHLLIEGAMRTG